MWYPSAIATAPASLLTVDEAKAHLRIDSNDEDELIAARLDTARAYVEQYCGVRIGVQTVTSKCDGFADLARLPEAPTTAVTEVSYVDGDGNTQTLSTSVYEARLDGLEGALALKYGQTWPTLRAGSRITVTATAGYDADTIPPPIRAAMLLLIGDWYENRQTIAVGANAAQLPLSAPVEALLCNYRRGV